MKLSREQLSALLNPQGEDMEALSRVFFAHRAGTGFDYLHGDGDVDIVIGMAVNYAMGHQPQHGESK